MPFPRRTTGFVMLGLTLGVAAIASGRWDFFAGGGVTVTPATGGEAISADTARGGPAEGWTELSPVVIAESKKQDIKARQSDATLVLTLPPGFEFDASHPPSIAGVSEDIPALVAAVTETTLTVTLTSNNPAKVVDTITIGGVAPIRVRPTAGSPLASGEIARLADAGGTLQVDGAEPGTGSFGTLGMAPGAAARVAILTQPGGSTGPDVPLAPQPVVAVQDAAGNTRTGDDSTVVTATLTGGSGSLGGTRTETVVDGVADFASHGLAVDLAGAGKVLTFSAPGLESATSAPFSVASGPPTPTPTSSPTPTPTPPPPDSCPPEPDAAPAPAPGAGLPAPSGTPSPTAVPGRTLEVHGVAIPITEVASFVVAGEQGTAVTGLAPWGSITLYVPPGALPAGTMLSVDAVTDIGALQAVAPRLRSARSGSASASSPMECRATYRHCRPAPSECARRFRRRRAPGCGRST